MLFSFAFISSRGASMIFFFLSVLCLIGLNKMERHRIYFISFFFVFVLLFPLIFFTQTPQYKYEQFNEKHVASIEWMSLHLNKNSKIYSDVKMAKAIAVKAGLLSVNPPLEFQEFMEEEIIPVYFSENLNAALKRFKFYDVNYLVLTDEMSSLMVQPANELLEPATALSKFDYSSSLNKIFENKQVKIYEVN
jgi:uncharacterized membrane protein